MRSLVPSVLLFLVVAIAMPAPAEEALAEPTWDEIRAETVARLRMLAKWCRRSKLYGRRALMCQRMLHFAPDDEDAHKWLKHRKQRDGTWLVPPRKKLPRDMGRGRKEFDARFDELVDWYAEAVGPLIRDADAAVARREREAAILGAVVLDPDRAAFRAWNDEVREGGDDGRWILRESEITHERRPALKRLSRDLYDKLPEPRDGAVGDADRRAGMRWAHSVEGVWVRVLGQTSRKELEQIVLHTECTWPFFQHAFSLEEMPSRGSFLGRTHVTYYVFEEGEPAMRFFAAWPGVTPEIKAFARSCVSYPMPTGWATLVKSWSAPSRVEAGPRTFLWSLCTGVLGLGEDDEWAREGLQTYLTERVARTRLLYSMSMEKDRYAKKGRKLAPYDRDLHDAESSWLVLGRDLFRSEDKPSVHLMPGKHISHLSGREILYAYCLAAYLVEGRPKQAAAFYTRLGAQDRVDLDALFLDTLGMTVQTTEERLTRWLEETAES